MRGRFATAPSKPWGSDKWQITLEIDEQPTVYDELKEQELSIELKKYRKKRSLDANAYQWVLCTKIAEKLGTSKEEVQDLMIQRYSDFDKDEDGYITITMLDRIPVSKLGGHWKLIGQNGKFNSYMRLVGSSEMDSAQMARLLEGVVSEAKELGINTETPDEIERMKALWQKA